MSNMEKVESVSVPASADLSSNQFKFMLVDSSGELALVAAAGGDSDGVLLNAPAAQGRPGELGYLGRLKVIIGTGDLTAGDKVQSDATGLAITAASGDHVLGKCLVGGVAGELGEVLFGASKHILA